MIGLDSFSNHRAGSVWAVLTRPVAFLAAIGLPPIILFTAVPLWGGDALPHWQVPGWLFLLPILGHAIALQEERRQQLHLATRCYAIAAAAVLALAIFAVALIRVMPPTPVLTARIGINTWLEETMTWRDLAETLKERGRLQRLRPPCSQARSVLQWSPSTGWELLASPKRSGRARRL